MRAWITAVAAALFCAAAFLPAGANGSSRDAAADGTSLSIGFPFRGRLIGAAELTESDGIAFKYGSPERERFGTDELVGMLRRASARVAEHEGGPALLVGDLSLESGGRMRPHLSHRSGRDVDVAFYMLGEDRAPAGYASHDRFVRVRRDGSAAGGRPLSFDARRNWRLLESMLIDPDAQVSHVLVARHLQSALLEEAERSGARADVIERAREVMQQPPRGGKHDDHFHVRISCPEADEPECKARRPALPQLAPLG